MKDLEHARAMLALAEKDLKAIRAMNDKDDFSDEIFGFHAQQAVEKSLKAWLSHSGVKYPRIHNLEELFELLKANGQKIPDDLMELSDLTDFAVQMRYEFVEGSEGELERERTLQKVEKLFRFVTNLMSRE